MLFLWSLRLQIIYQTNLSSFVLINCHSLNVKLRAEEHISTFQTAINLLNVRSAWDMENIWWIVSYSLMCQAYDIHKPAAVYFLKTHWVSSGIFFLLLSFFVISPIFLDLEMEWKSSNFLSCHSWWSLDVKILLLFLPIIITAKALHFCLLEPHTSGFFFPPPFWCLDKFGLIKGTIYLKKLPTNSSALHTQAHFNLNVDQSVYRCFRRDFYRNEGGGSSLQALKPNANLSHRSLLCQGNYFLSIWQIENLIISSLPNCPSSLF